MQKNWKNKLLAGLMIGVLWIGSITPVRMEAAEKIRLSQTSMTLEVGKSRTLHVKNGKGRIVWSSNKIQIAKVDKNGRVTAKKKGNAIITAKLKGKKYTCKVFVKKRNAQKPDCGEFHTGEATFYEPSSGGAANLDDLARLYDTAALNTADYLDDLAGAYLEVTDGDGDQVKVLITDRLPEGKKGDIDLSKKAFCKIEPERTGRMKVHWRIIPLPTKHPIAYKFKSGSSKWWAEVQVRNHRYPIRSLEYKNAQGKYVKLERKEYNYFQAPSGMGEGPFTFRVTDIYGQVLIDRNIKMDLTNTPINGKANFPYRK